MLFFLIREAFNSAFSNWFFISLSSVQSEINAGLLVEKNNQPRKGHHDILTPGIAFSSPHPNLWTSHFLTTFFSLFFCVNPFLLIGLSFAAFFTSHLSPTSVAASLCSCHVPVSVLSQTPTHDTNVFNSFFFKNTPPRSDTFCL